MLGYAIPSARSFAAFSRLLARWDHHDRNQNLAQFRASFFCCTLFFYWIFYFSLFYNPFKNPPPPFPVESYTHKVFPFLVEWATFFVSTDEQILNLSTRSEYCEIQGSCSVVDKIWSLPVHDAVLIGKWLMLTYVLPSTWTNIISFISGC